MKIKSAIFGLISLKPQSINAVVTRLPYSQNSIYNAIEEMIKNGDLVKIKIKDGVKVDIPRNYSHQKKRELFIKSLSYGIDPDIFLRKTTHRIWTALDKENSASRLSKETNISEKTVRKFLQLIAQYGLITIEKKRPLIVKKDTKHPLGIILNAVTNSEEETQRLYKTGSNPFDEIITTPSEIEKILYEKIDANLTVKKTGFLVTRKRGKIAILESVPKHLTPEEVFIKQIQTPEGVEDICIQLLATNKINYKRLLIFSKENNLVNVIGCYLDIIYDINSHIIPKEIIKQFHDNLTSQKIIFLKDDKTYGKAGWEKKYEQKWNVDLYLDLGAIKHGVRMV